MARESASVGTAVLSLEHGIDLPTIDFSRVRAHGGSKKDGFEELCVQIFHRDAGSHGEFRRVEGAGGDQGVEAFVVRRDRSEIGLQCKFFERLGPVQWRQIDKSVRTAVEKHPRLTEYRISLPLNRTPAQLQAWEMRQKRWKKLTKRKIDFVWWGKSELSNLLSKHAYQGLLIYWFGVPQFTGEWMDQVIEASLKNLDRRYSPKQHVDTESGRRAEIFAWSPTFSSLLQRSLVNLADAWRKYIDSLARERFDEPISAEASIFATTMEGLLASEIPSIEGLSVSAALRDADSALLEWERIHESVRELERQRKSVKAEPDSASNRDYQFFLMSSDKVGHYLGDWRDLLDQGAIADRRRLLVLGEAGTGKSHLIASIVANARKRGQPALFLLGEQFTAADEPWSQAIKVMGWQPALEWLLSALDQAGRLAKLPALICVDALNESDNRNLWVSHLEAFAARVQPYSFVRLIVSCRSDFKEITLPQRLAAGEDTAWSTIWHQGFGEEVFEAVANYFSGYGVESTHFPPLIEEFRNPLFLRLFCEAFQNQRLPDGPLTLERVMSARITSLTVKLQQDIDCSAEDVKGAIYAVARLIQKNEGRAVDREVIRAAVNEFSAERKHSRALYTHLRSSGILIEVSPAAFDEQTPGDVRVRFAFERFSDYFIAAELLSGIRSTADLKVSWKGNGRFAWLADPDAYWRNRGLLLALAILIPERFRLELSELVRSRELRYQVLEDFLASLPWRSPASITKRTRQTLRQSQQLGLSNFLQAILRLATIPGHPYNAEFLHRSLKQMRLPVRETNWTIPIARLTTLEASVPSMIVMWAMRVSPKLISDDQALLVARVLCWFLSSNRRAFRKRAAVAAIRILEGRAAVAGQLIKDFDDVDDPYVVERVYGVACGVAMRSRASAALRDLSAVVHDAVFEKELVRPNILLRDYAQTILEVAAERGSLPNGVERASFRAPFKSKWPKIWTEGQVKKVEEDEGWNRIVFSVRPEGMGMYGDFGRYVMESRVHQFSNVPKTRPLPTDPIREVFDGKTARRWVLQRVKQLGWAPGRFAQYERNLPWDGRHEDDELKIERISKKYQWIALNELLGYLSDHYHMRPPWQSDPQELFMGAWQIRARDFDPSQALVETEDKYGEPEPSVADRSIASGSESPYPNPFLDIALCARRVDWVLTKPADFKPLIHYPRSVGAREGEWLALNGFWNWNESEYQVHRLSVPGRLRMWAHLRSWIVRQNDISRFLKLVRKTHFWGHGCQGVSLGHGWIGEYPWGDAFKETKKYCETPDDWIANIQIPHIQTTCDWDTEAGFIVPSPKVCELLSLRWSGIGARFLDQSDTLTALQTGSIGASKHGPCIVRMDALRSALRRSHLGIVWALLGERECWDGSRFIGDKGTQFSAVYTIDQAGIRGGLTKHVVVPFEQ